MCAVVISCCINTLLSLVMAPDKVYIKLTSEFKFLLLHPHNTYNQLPKEINAELEVPSMVGCFLCNFILDI